MMTFCTAVQWPSPSNSPWPITHLALVHLDQARAGGRRAGKEHLALEVGLDAADDQAEARQSRTHDLAQVGDARILQQLEERAVVDVAVGVEVGEAQMFGRGEAVDATVGKIEGHCTNSMVRWAASEGGTSRRAASGFTVFTPFFASSASQAARLSTRMLSSAG